jgi:hypothetical protein
VFSHPPEAYRFFAAFFFVAFFAVFFAMLFLQERWLLSRAHRQRVVTTGGLSRPPSYKM